MCLSLLPTSACLPPTIGRIGWPVIAGCNQSLLGTGAHRRARRITYRFLSAAGAAAALRACLPAL